MAYLKALFISWVAFAAAFVAWNMSFFGVRQSVPAGLIYWLGGGMFFGLFFFAVLGVGTGPLLWRMVRKNRDRSKTSVAAISGGLAPLHVIVVWLIMREDSETWRGLLGAWHRLPSGEWALLWPAFVAVAVFGATAAKSEPAKIDR